MAILLEHPMYKEGPHEHFDLIYLAVIDKTKDRKPAESSGNMGWFSEKELAELNTFENCRTMAHRALEAHKRYMKTHSS